jgi:hypothetical protein
MRIRFREAVSGPYWYYLPREEVELEPAVAAAYLESGVAEVVRESEPEETATLEAPRGGGRPDPKRRGGA